jgi:hypothetical protein
LVVSKGLFFHENEHIPGREEVPVPSRLLHEGEQFLMASVLVYMVQAVCRRYNSILKLRIAVNNFVHHGDLHRIAGKAAEQVSVIVLPAGTPKAQHGERGGGEDLQQTEYSKGCCQRKEEVQGNPYRRKEKHTLRYKNTVGGG